MSNFKNFDILGISSSSSTCTGLCQKNFKKRAHPIVFNPRSKEPIQATLKLCGKSVLEVESYCYLGIEIEKSGKFTLARNELKKKAIRSLYSLKSTINKKHLSFRALTTLFDSLIKPIALYGAPIWTADMAIIRNLTKLCNSDQSESNSSILRKISLLESERIHIHFLKWALGVHRKASNAGVWGETGRYPLIYESINLLLRYFNRVKNLKNGPLVHLAYQEQKLLNLEWYRSIELILKIDPCYSTDHVSSFRLHKTTSNHKQCTIPQSNN